MRKLLLFATTAAAFAGAPALAQTQTVPGQTRPGTTATQGAPRAEVVEAVEFVRMAAISDMFEIQSSQLAMQRSQNPQVRQFAQEMAQDHQRTTNELQQLVRQMHGAAPPPGSGSTAGAAPRSGEGGGGAASSSGHGASGAHGPGAAATGSSARDGADARGSATGGGDARAETDMAQAMQIPNRLDARHQQMLRQLQMAQGAGFDRLYAQQQVEAHRSAVDMFQNYARGGDNEQLRQFAQRTLPTLEDHLRKAQQLQSAARG